MRAILRNSFSPSLRNTGANQSDCNFGYTAGVAEALDRGLAMEREERRERHAAMLAVMRRNSLDTWRDRFVADLS